MRGATHVVPNQMYPVLSTFLLLFPPGESGENACTSVPLSSRYYLNCSLESHHAAYTWVHRGEIVAHCNPGVDPCTHFINQISTDSEGKYACISRERWFEQTLVTRCLAVKPAGDQQTVPPGSDFPDSKGLVLSPTALKGVHPRHPPGNRAATALRSFWLQLLYTMAMFVLLK